MVFLKKINPSACLRSRRQTGEPRDTRLRSSLKLTGRHSRKEGAGILRPFFPLHFLFMVAASVVFCALVVLLGASACPPYAYDFQDHCECREPTPNCSGPACFRQACVSRLVLLLYSPLCFNSRIKLIDSFQSINQ